MKTVIRIVCFVLVLTMVFALGSCFKKNAGSADGGKSLKADLSDRKKPERAGDVNGDELVNAKDVTAIMKHLVGKTPSKWDENAADYNGDGGVNAKDVTEMMKEVIAQAAG